MSEEKRELQKTEKKLPPAEYEAVKKQKVLKHLFIAFIMVIVMEVILGLFKSYLSKNVEVEFLRAMLQFSGELLTAFVVIVISMLMMKGVYKEKLFTGFFPVKNIHYYFIGSLFAAAVLYFLDSYALRPIQSIFPETEIFKEAYNKMLDTEKQFFIPLAAAAASVIIMPLKEEIFLRGFAYTTLRKEYKIFISIVITALLYFLFHPQFDMILTSLLLSIVLCLSYEMTRALFVPVTIHMTYNLITVLVNIF